MGAEKLKTELQIVLGTPPRLGKLMHQVYQEAGMRGFFQGNLANCLKAAPQSALFFLLIDYLKKTLPTRGQPQYVDLHSFLAGSIAGLASQIIIYPLEPIKTILTVAPPGAYRGILDSARRLVAARGIAGLYG